MKGNHRFQWDDQDEELIEKASDLNFWGNVEILPMGKNWYKYNNESFIDKHGFWYLACINNLFFTLTLLFLYGFLKLWLNFVIELNFLKSKKRSAKLNDTLEIGK